MSIAKSLFFLASFLPAVSLARELASQIPVSPKTLQGKGPNVVARLVGANTQEVGRGKGKNGGPTYWPGIQGFDGDLKYWGGDLLTSELTIHFLFYGDWNKNDGKDIEVVTNFVASLTDDSAESPSVKKWWDITTKYTDKDGAGVAGTVKVGTVLKTVGDYTPNLNDMQNGKGDDIFALVADRIKDGSFPQDKNSIYVVMTSPDVAVGIETKKFGGGFCEAYCGYHYVNELDDGSKITYAFVGNSDKCPQGCSPYKLTISGTPNGYSGVDNSISILAHELAEAASDPYLNGWYTEGQGWENGDVCAWTFTDDQGFPTLLKQGPAYFNLNGVGGFKYLVQTLPDPVKQVCLVQVDSALAKVQNQKPVGPLV